MRKLFLALAVFFMFISCGSSGGGGGNGSPSDFGERMTEIAVQGTYEIEKILYRDDTGTHEIMPLNCDKFKGLITFDKGNNKTVIKLQWNCGGTQDYFFEEDAYPYGELVEFYGDINNFSMIMLYPYSVDDPEYDPEDDDDTIYKAHRISEQVQNLPNTPFW